MLKELSASIVFFFTLVCQSSTNLVVQVIDGLKCQVPSTEAATASGWPTSNLRKSLNELVDKAVADYQQHIVLLGGDISTESK